MKININILVEDDYIEANGTVHNIAPHVLSRIMDLLNRWPVVSIIEADITK